MLYDGKIMLGAGYDGPDYLVPEMAIRDMGPSRFMRSSIICG